MDNSPYSPPSSQPDPLEKSATNQREWFIKLALILYSGPLWGLVLTVINLIRALEHSQPYQAVMLLLKNWPKESIIHSYGACLEEL